MELAQHRLELCLLERMRSATHCVRVKAELAQLLARLGDTEPALREGHRTRPEDRAMLHEPTVGGDERDRDSEREERDHVAVVVPDDAADDCAAKRSGPPDR